MLNVCLLLLLALSAVDLSTSSGIKGLRIPSEEQKKIQHWNMMKGHFLVEKGVRCKGGESDHCGGFSCEGGSKAHFCGETSAKEVTDYMATDVREQLLGAIPTADDVFPPDHVAEIMYAFDDESSFPELLEDGGNKTVSFGGYMKAEWGCNVTFYENAGKYSKSVECGVRFKKGMSKHSEEGEACEEEDL